MDVLSNPTYLKAFAVINVMWLGMFTGVALGLYLFTVPVIEQSPSTAIMLPQFRQMITFGFRYMQGGSRLQAIPHLALVYLFYQHPDPEIASRWKYFAAAILVGVQSVWYEIVTIFPTNDILLEMEGPVKAMDEEQDRKVRAEVLRLLGKWKRWHIGRIVLPAVSFGLSVCGLLF